MEAHHHSSSPPTTIQFPVNLNCSSHHHNLDDDDDQEGPNPIMPNSSDHHEMDFFSDKKLDGKSSKENTATDAAGADDAKDLSGPSELGFNVNVRL